MKKTFTFLSLLTAFNWTAINAQNISMGGSHSLFLCNSSNNPMSTGSNTYGELGNGTTTQTLTPGAVNSITGVKAVSAGLSHSLFLKNDSTVWSCGRNNFGELGNGTTSSLNSSNPTVSQASSLSGIIA